MAEPMKLDVVEIRLVDYLGFLNRIKKKKQRNAFSAFINVIFLLLRLCLRKTNRESICINKDFSRKQMSRIILPWSVLAETKGGGNGG